MYPFYIQNINFNYNNNSNNSHARERIDSSTIFPPFEFTTNVEAQSSIIWYLNYYKRFAVGLKRFGNSMIVEYTSNRSIEKYFEFCHPNRPPWILKNYLFFYNPKLCGQSNLYVGVARKQPITAAAVVRIEYRYIYIPL